MDGEDGGVEAWLVLEDATSEELTGTFADFRSRGIELARLPVERTVAPTEALIAAGIVLAWAGTLSTVGASVAWIINRFRRGVIVDARGRQVRISPSRALPLGQVIVLGPDGKMEIREEQVAKALHDIAQAKRL
ncbi:hypothetical protein [Micromonospora inaquosa]|uniref:Uncharacterized protein n=1 Tax=Micromonospora inaquosa TaxID=2203716 RepID=A0A3N9XH75_9ACTN|nr:hypothetical protein [Micromonospora inaquosa]RQX05907.1 hypothetical protein DLJ59_06250 [Micromonospora inaquosa]